MNYRGKKVRITQGYPEHIGKIGVVSMESGTADMGKEVACDVFLEDGNKCSPYMPDSHSPECEWVPDEPIQDIVYSIDNIRGKKIAIDASTQEEYDKCLAIFAAADIQWRSYHKATDKNYYEEDKGNSYLFYEPTQIWRNNCDACNRNNNITVITAEQFIADNTETYTIQEAIEYAKGNDVAIACPTQEIWDEVIRYEATNRGTPVVSKHWGSYEQDSCINVNNGKFTFGDTKFYESEKYEIITIKQPQIMDKQTLQ